MFIYINNYIIFLNKNSNNHIIQNILKKNNLYQKLLLKNIFELKDKFIYILIINQFIKSKIYDKTSSFY